MNQPNLLPSKLRHDCQVWGNPGVGYGYVPADGSLVFRYCGKFIYINWVFHEIRIKLIKYSFWLKAISFVIIVYISVLCSMLRMREAYSNKCGASGIKDSPDNSILYSGNPAEVRVCILIWHISVYISEAHINRIIYYLLLLTCELAMYS